MEKEIKIKVPEGMEIDKENSTFECIKFKPVKKELPKTWEEYCKTYPIREGESWISDFGKILHIDVLPTPNTKRNCIVDRNLLPNEEYAKAMLALCQLIQLRDCYNDGWVPDWSNDINPKYCIIIFHNHILKSILSETSTILAFKTEELRDKFLNNFRDLIEIAKPLL